MKDERTDSGRSNGDSANESDHGGTSQPSAVAESVNPAGAMAFEDQKTVISKKRRGSSQPVQITQSVSPQEMGKILQGQMLNHFRLEEFVGGGGMGAVFRAMDTELGRTVAVKVVASRHADSDTLSRFKNEAQSAAQLDHPQIARVYYVGEDDGWNYIVFEYIEGVNIRDLVDHKGPLSLDEAISYTLQVAEALDHASERNIVHRDIKPSNVLVMPDGRVKLVDMGLARLHRMHQPSSRDLTESGVTLGTFDYISPEQARDPRQADVRSDMYSLGCTFFFMLTGTPPFPDGTVLRKLLDHSTQSPPNPRDYRSDLPEEVSAILDMLLAKTPDKRFQTPSELIGSLMVLAEKYQLSSARRPGRVLFTNERSTTARLERILPVLVPVIMLFAVVALAETVWGPDEPLRFPSIEFDQTAEADTVVPGGDPRDGGGTGDSTNQRSAADSGQTSGESPAVTEPTGPTGDEGTDDASPGSAATIDAATTAPPGDTKTVTSAVRVGPPGTSLSGGTIAAVSLADACAHVSGLASIDRVEIVSQTQPFRERPFQLAASPPQRITIRGYTDASTQEQRRRGAVITFRPTTEEKAMIRLTGGAVTWENIHFEVVLPNEPSDGWSLFKLMDVSSLSFVNCSMTIRNPGGDTQRAVFIDWSFEKNDGDPLPPMAVNLSHCIVRGQATMLNLPKAYPGFRLDWEDGLLVTTGRLLESGGLNLAADYPTLDIRLTKVTAVVQKGLYRINYAEQHEVLVRPALRNCILWTYSPIFEHTYTSLDEEPKMPEVTGDGNFYHQANALLRIHSENGVESVFTLGQLDELKDKEWYKEDVPGMMVMWRELPSADTPVDRQVPEDYILSPVAENPALRAGKSNERAGFSQLPPLPEVFRPAISTDRPSP